MKTQNNNGNPQRRKIKKALKIRTVMLDRCGSIRDFTVNRKIKKYNCEPIVGLKIFDKFEVYKGVILNERITLGNIKINKGEIFQLDDCLSVRINRECSAEEVESKINEIIFDNKIDKYSHKQRLSIAVCRYIISRLGCTRRGLFTFGFEDVGLL